jgi:copper(I)-binding protein
MPYTTHRRVLLLGTLLAAALVAALLVATAHAGTKSSTVTLSEFKVSPSPKSVSHGKVTFTVKNKGDMKHELVVIKTSAAASKLSVS